MTPQSDFMVLGTINPEREAELRRLLESMNDAPGHVNPSNALIPFGQFDTVHVARFVILKDNSPDDVLAYGLPRRDYPLYLAFLGNVDGDADIFLEDVARRASPGLRAIFSCCKGLSPETDLFDWMKRNSRFPAAAYTNWLGRTVRRVREEAALHEALENYVQNNAAVLAGLSPSEIHAALWRFVDAEKSAGRLTLSKESPTPLKWRIDNLLRLIVPPLLTLLASPILIPVGLVFLSRIRRLEKTDPELSVRVDQAYSDGLAKFEDHDVTNQFSIMGSIKPGSVRLWTAIFVLRLVDYFARHVYKRGRFARIRTIHFARWVFLDDRKRMAFFSDYDGSFEGYMDDFINKVGFGLNVVFSNFVGYRRTNWLIFDGCADEPKHKELERHHTIPTQAWYKAYPSLTAVDLERNIRIRRGLESSLMSDKEAREWVALL
ncbi:MAG TPA: hypothetical protein VIS96_04855 [Terrimicrobiaceae bacterium]